MKRVTVKRVTVKRVTRRVGLAGLLALMLLSPMFLGCGARVHMRADHGKAYETFFKRQRLFSEAAEGAPGGLNSEEAAAIHARYRGEFAGGKGKAEGPARVLLLEGDKGGKRK